MFYGPLSLVRMFYGPLSLVRMFHGPLSLVRMFYGPLSLVRMFYGPLSLVRMFYGPPYSCPKQCSKHVFATENPSFVVESRVGRVVNFIRCQSWERKFKDACCM